MVHRAAGIGLVVGLACGPSPAMEGTDTDATGSEPAVCGNGVVEDDEACDDGNDVPGDACDACTLPPASEVWSVAFDGPAHEHDYLRAVGFTASGQVYAAGSQGLADGTKDLVVRKLDVDGTLLWERVFAGDAGKFDGAWALAVMADGGVVVVGSTDAEVSSGAQWARRYTAEGDDLWTFTSPPLVDGNSLTGVAVMGDALLVAGYEAGEQGVLQVAVRRLDADSGAQVWRREYDRESLATAAARDGDSLVVAGWQRAADGGDEAIVQRWGADGTLRSTWTWAAPDALSTTADAVAVLPGGTIAVAVGANTSNTSEGSFLVGFAGDGTVQWATRIETEWRLPSLMGLAADDTGRLFATGSAEVERGRIRGMLGLVNANGAVLKLEILGAEEILSQFWSIAVHASGFVVAGNICTHTTCDQWIRKYAPL